MNQPNTTCPVCGYPSLDEPAYGDAGVPSYEICPSCETEFGYDDDGIELEELRREWLSAGAPWRSKVVPMPTDWDGPTQLATYTSATVAAGARRRRHGA